MYIATSVCSGSVHFLLGSHAIFMYFVATDEFLKGKLADVDYVRQMKAQLCTFRMQNKIYIFLVDND